MFFAGFGTLAYIVLWVVVPEAKTAGDRLAMMGEPANVHNIAKMIERGIDDLSETIKGNWKEFKSKKKSDDHEGVHSMRYSGKNWLLGALKVPFVILRYLFKALIKVIRSLSTKRSRYYYEKHPFV